MKNTNVESKIVQIGKADAQVGSVPANLKDFLEFSVQGKTNKYSLTIQVIIFVEIDLQNYQQPPLNF